MGNYAMKTLFGNSKLISKNKHIAHCAELDDDPAEKEYTVTVEYAVVEIKKCEHIKVIKVRAQTEEEAIELVEDQIHARLDDNEEIDTITSTITRVDTNDIKDTKTLNMFTNI